MSWVAEGTVAFWDAHLKEAPRGPWLEPAAAKANSDGRVRVEEKVAPAVEEQVVPVEEEPAP